MGSVARSHARTRLRVRGRLDWTGLRWAGWNGLGWSFLSCVFCVLWIYALVGYWLR
jgi:hypothetical protein